MGADAENIQYFLQIEFCYVLIEDGCVSCG